VKETLLFFKSAVSIINRCVWYGAVTEKPFHSFLSDGYLYREAKSTN